MTSHSATYDNTAEQALIGAIILNEEILQNVVQVLPVESFYKEAHRIIVRTLQTMRAAGKPLDTVTITSHLKERGDLDRVGGPQYVNELWDVCPTSCNWRHYAQIVKDLATRRRQVDISRTIAQKSRAGEDIGPELEILQTLRTGCGVVERSQFECAADWLTASPMCPDYLLDKMIEVGTTGQLFGPSGGGKTFIALDMALSVATGREWCGRRVREGLVLYLAGEGKAGLFRRVSAWSEHHTIPPADLSLLHISRNTITMRGENLPDVIAEARALVDRHGVPVAMFVVDTLARHIDGDENGSYDMGVFIKAVDSLRDALPGSVALIVHHTGHGEDSKHRARGNSSLKGAMDFEFRIGDGLIECTKMKDAEQTKPIEFKLYPVQIGVHDDGEPLTSCIVSYGERSEANREVKVKINFTAIERAAVRALIDASVKHPQKHGGMIGALVGDWRESFYRIRRENEPEVLQHSLKVSFQRVQESLSGKSAIQNKSDAQFLTRQDHQTEIFNLSAHGTQTAQTAQCAGDTNGTIGTHLYKRCADVTVSVPPPDVTNHTFTEEDFEEAA